MTNKGQYVTDMHAHKKLVNGACVYLNIKCNQYND